MIDVTSKNLHIQLSASENITTYISGGNLQVIYGDGAKLKTVKAINYIKSGMTEIATAVTEGIENFNSNAGAKTIIFDNNAIDKTAEFDDNATKAINEAKSWAEQAESSAQSMAQRDLSNLTATGEAKFSAKQDVISDLATIRSGAALGATAVQPSALNGYATENWVGQQGYITGITSSDVTTALGYTPYNSSNPNGYITSSALTPYVLSSSLATVATSGDYNDLTNTPDLTTKADVDLSNINTSGKSFASGLGMPSDRYIDLTIGASGSTYTAPANGYFCFNGKDSSNTGTAEVVLRNQTRYFGVAGSNATTRTPSWSGYILPAKKGDIVSLYYIGTLALNNTNWAWRFYYAEGDS